MSKSRNRGYNYTEREKQELLSFVEKYKYVIENKKTDNTTLKEKQDCWQKIASEYNSIVERPRAAEHLKSCYHNIKRNAKQKTANERGKEYLEREQAESDSTLIDGCAAENMFLNIKKVAKHNKSYDKVESVRTGGGIYTTKTTETDERILAICEEQFNPLPNAYDDAATYFKDNDKEFFIINMNEEQNTKIEDLSVPILSVNLGDEGRIQKDNDKAVEIVPDCSLQNKKNPNEITGVKRKLFKEKLSEYTSQRKKKLETETNLMKIYNEKKLN